MLADIQVDAIVIGAGVAGLAAARALAEAKMSVALLEARDRIGGTHSHCQARGMLAAD